MKPRPLIDPASKPEVPGSFLVSNGRYYWHIPQWVKRKRLVPKGETFSTKDKATALKLAKKLWNQIKKNDPELAANVRKYTRVNGMATKDRAVAEKVAAEMWEQIQKKSPKLAAKILTDNRPRAKDHWHAQFCSERHHRFLGSFKTQAEAEAAYVKEFEKVWGYPPGYDVRCIPKIDKVWPTWTEEKARLALMDGHPRLPVIGKSAEPLMTGLFPCFLISAYHFSPRDCIAISGNATGELSSKTNMQFSTSQSTFCIRSTIGLSVSVD